jgi:hypothetical protein
MFCSSSKGIGAVLCHPALAIAKCQLPIATAGATHRTENENSDRSRPFWRVLPSVCLVMINHSKNFNTPEKTVHSPFWVSPRGRSQEARQGASLARRQRDSHSQE